MNKYLIFLFFFFSCLFPDSFVLIFPSSFWGLVSNIFFLTRCLSFIIWSSSFLCSSWLGCRILSWVLELSSFLSVVSFFGRGSTVFFFFLFLKLIYLIFAVSFFGRGSTVVLLFWGVLAEVEVLILRSLSLFHQNQPSPKIDFHHS